jgi:hypothetical protein
VSARMRLCSPNHGNGRPTSTWVSWGAWSAQCQTDKSALAKLAHVGDQRHLIGERSPRRQVSPRASSRTPSRNHINLHHTPLGFRAYSRLLDLPSQDISPFPRRLWSESPIEHTEGLLWSALASEQASRRTLPLDSVSPATGASELLLARRTRRISNPIWAKSPIKSRHPREHIDEHGVA